MERCSYNHDCYGCSRIHVLMLKTTLFHNNIPISVETKIENTWLEYINWDLYWHGKKKTRDG